MAKDLLVVPDLESPTGLLDQEDLLVQDFLLALLNYGERFPYEPERPVLPITKLLLTSGNVPTPGQVSLAFGLSRNGLRTIMRQYNSRYQDAQLLSAGPGDQPDSLQLRISILMQDGSSVLIEKSFTIGTLDG